MNLQNKTFSFVIQSGVMLVMACGVSASAGTSKSKEIQRAAEAQVIRSAVERREIVPLPRILALAQKHVPGEIVKVELEHDDGRLHYEIKILSSTGRVREVKLDARTAALMKIEDD